MADAKIGVLTPKGLTERVNPIKAAFKGEMYPERLGS